MKFSIALCTYNGAKYLAEQLDSIAAQTRLPDELVACDDRSKDETVAILEAFAARVPFPVQIVVNEQNIGSTKNFEKAITLCTGDLIALADQDDVWMPEKLALLEDVFVREPEVGLVFTNADVVDQELKPLGRKLWDNAPFGSKQQKQVHAGRAFDLLFERNFVTGATMAFRSVWREFVLPIPKNIAIIHDGWIALLIASVAPLAFLPASLIAYRQHPQQQMGAPVNAPLRVLARSHYEGHIRQIETIIQRLESADLSMPIKDKKTRIGRMQAHIRHLHTRLALPPGRLHRVFPILREALTRRYHVHSKGFRSIARDLLY